MHFSQIQIVVSVLRGGAMKTQVAFAAQQCPKIEPFWLIFNPWI